MVLAELMAYTWLETFGQNQVQSPAIFKALVFPNQMYFTYQNYFGLPGVVPA